MGRMGRGFPSISGFSGFAGLAWNWPAKTNPGRPASCGRGLQLQAAPRPGRLIPGRFRQPRTGGAVPFVSAAGAGVEMGQIYAEGAEGEALPLVRLIDLAERQKMPYNAAGAAIARALVARSAVRLFIVQRVGFALPMDEGLVWRAGSPGRQAGIQMVIQRHPGSFDSPHEVRTARFESVTAAAPVPALIGREGAAEFFRLATQHASGPDALRRHTVAWLAMLETEAAGLLGTAEVLALPVATVAPTAEPAGRCVKREELLRANRNEWPSIENDLKNSGVNGLSEAAKADRRGWWHEERAREWARSRGKLKEPVRHVLRALSGR